MFIVYINENYKLCTHQLLQVGADIYCPPIDENNIIIGCYINGRKYLIKEHLSDIEIYYNMEILTNIEFVQKNHFEMRGRTFLISLALLTQVSCQVPEEDQHESLNQHIIKKADNYYDLSITTEGEKINVNSIFSGIDNDDYELFFVNGVNLIKLNKPVIYQGGSLDSYKISEFELMNKQTISTYSSWFTGQNLDKLKLNKPYNFTPKSMFSGLTMNWSNADFNNSIPFAYNTCESLFMSCQGSGVMEFTNLTFESNKPNVFRSMSSDIVVKFPNITELLISSSFRYMTNRIEFPKLKSFGDSSIASPVFDYHEAGFSLLVNSFLKTNNLGGMDATIQKLIDSNVDVSFVD